VYNDPKWSILLQKKDDSADQLSIYNYVTGQKPIIFYTNNTTTISGTFNKPGGSFLIDHPVTPLTHTLRHSFVEAPRMDLIYRGRCQLTNGVGTVDVNAVSRMRAGTLEALTKNRQVLVNNNETWDRVRATVDGAIVSIEAESPINITVEWLVIGERCDVWALESSGMLDENGDFICEAEKPDVPEKLLEKGGNDNGKPEAKEDEIPDDLSEYKGHYMYPEAWQKSNDRKKGTEQ
jgi:hypothetical protein